MIKFIKERFVFEFYNEWEQFFSKYNWYTFTPIAINFEKSNFTGGLEFEFFFLGFGIFIRYNTDRAMELFKGWDKEWKKESDKIIKKSTSSKKKTAKKTKK